jgi:hypothetical protein
MPYWVQWCWWMADHYEIPTALVCCYIAQCHWCGRCRRRCHEAQTGLQPVPHYSRVELRAQPVQCCGLGARVTAFVASGAEHGFAGPDSVLCRRNVQFDNQWVALFCLSKIPELADTALLML